MKRTSVSQAATSKVNLSPRDNHHGTRSNLEMSRISPATTSWSKYADSRLKLFGTVRS
jgi:hypothetical protein